MGLLLAALIGLLLLTQSCVVTAVEAHASESITVPATPQGEGVTFAAGSAVPPPAGPAVGSVVDQPVPAVNPIFITVNHPALKSPLSTMLSGPCCSTRR